jgi:hypothetical protein
MTTPTIYEAPRVSPKPGEEIIPSTCAIIAAGAVS